MVVRVFCSCLVSRDYFIDIKFVLIYIWGKLGSKEVFFLKVFFINGVGVLVRLFKIVFYESIRFKFLLYIYK